MTVGIDIWFLVALSFFILLVGLLSGMFLSRLLRQ